MPQTAQSPRRSYAHAPRLAQTSLADTPLADTRLADTRLADTAPLDLRDLFASQGAARPTVELEIGCARGGFLLERLVSEPAVHLVGLEIRSKAATLAWEKIQQMGHADRCRVFCEDARQVLPRLPSQSVARVFIHFPDPWWKKRHGKRRLASLELLSQVARVLQPAGQLLIQTDVSDLAQAFLQAAEAEPNLKPCAASVLVDHNPFEARSPREKQATADGLPIFRLYYCRAP
ncbi:MAG TPA: tRNA (guanosine(46)-N7)-methyltransferase TrmB [Polyangiaceae bacterium]|nr:tRNA (guanosine(46)-N7)-methyltransferase TrmB [Polyangiaceae bacterium]